MSNFPVPPAVPEPPKGPNGLYLYARIFDEPTMVFKEITRRPRILAPFIVIALLVALRSFLMPDAVLRKQTELGFEAVEKFRPGTITPEVRDQALQQAVSFNARAKSAVFGSLGAMAGTAVGALVLWGLFSLAGAEITYGQQFSILLYGTAPAWLNSMVVLALTPVTHSATFSMGLGFLASADTSPVMHLLLASITIFAVWMVYLLALGQQIQRKAKDITGSLVLITIVWLCLTLLGAFFGAKFGAANAV